MVFLWIQTVTLSRLFNSLSFVLASVVVDEWLLFDSLFVEGVETDVDRVEKSILIFFWMPPFFVEPGENRVSLAAEFDKDIASKSWLKSGIGLWERSTINFLNWVALEPFRDSKNFERNRGHSDAACLQLINKVRKYRRNAASFL